MLEHTDTAPRERHGGGRPARARPAGAVVLRWHAHPCWPVRHNLRQALALLRGGASAVLLVRGEARRAYRHAVFPSDLSPASLAFLRRAMDMLPQAGFTLLHACRVGGEGMMRTAGVGDDTLEACRRRTERAARAACARFAAQAAPGDPRRLLARVLLLRQPCSAAIAAHAAMMRADLLVLDDAGSGLHEGWRRQGAVRALLRRTDCDLLLLGGGHAG